MWWQYHCINIHIWILGWFVNRKMYIFNMPYQGDGSKFYGQETSRNTWGLVRTWSKKEMDAWIPIHLRQTAPWRWFFLGCDVGDESVFPDAPPSARNGFLARVDEFWDVPSRNGWFDDIWWISHGWFSIYGLSIMSRILQQKQGLDETPVAGASSDLGNCRTAGFQGRISQGDVICSSNSTL